jgi:type IV secretion system protein VirB6
MWLGATLLLLGTVGVLVTSKIALAILLALGPVFVVLALFRGTRGLFVGWLKGMVLLALAPLFAVLGGSMILELAVPVLSSLAPAVPGEINAQAAMAFFVLGAVHVALMAIILSVATTIVSGWSVFGLAGSAERDAETAPARLPRGRDRSAAWHARRPPVRARPRRRARSASRARRSRPTMPAAEAGQRGSRSSPPARPRPRHGGGHRRCRARAASAAASARSPRRSMEKFK